MPTIAKPAPIRRSPTAIVHRRSSPVNGSVVAFVLLVVAGELDGAVSFAGAVSFDGEVSLEGVVSLDGVVPVVGVVVGVVEGVVEGVVVGVLGVWL